jgi:glycerophosphoryl diester phosphodiesterase
MLVSVPQLVAHRGYAAHYPENSLLAIRAAVEAGASFVEFDVQFTADNEAVLFHDRDLSRLCGRSGAVHDYTLEELGQFPLSEFNRFGYRFVGNRITTLAQCLAYLRTQPQVTAFVEIKRISLEQFDPRNVVKQILAQVSSMERRCVIISFGLGALKQVRAQSGIRIGAIVERWRERKQALVRELAPEFLFTNIDHLPRFGKLRDAGKVVGFECDDPEQAMRLHRRGMALVETFDFVSMHEQLELLSGGDGSAV